MKSAPDADAVEPSEATVHDGTYPISRPLFVFTNGEPTGNVKAFIEYALSDAGQKIVVETGNMTMPKK